MRAIPFVAALIFVLYSPNSAAEEERCDPPEASQDAKAKYDACMETQGSFGNWRVTQGCVADFREDCLAIEGGEVKFCSVTRTTNYQRGACLPLSCPEGNCTAGNPFGPCTGTMAVLRDLFGTLDEEDGDVVDCCEVGEECNGASSARGRAPLLLVFSLLIAAITSMFA